MVEAALLAKPRAEKCVVIKGMLQSPRIEDHMKTIGIEQSISNRSSFEHKCLNNINIYIKMQVSVMTKKTYRIFLMLLWCLLDRRSHLTVLVCS